jgi:hypothetical protein
VQSRRWVRGTIIEQIREDVWRHISAAATEEDIQLEAAALLRMTSNDVRSLALIQFVLSPQVRELLDGMPTLMRRLATTTVHEEERSTERVRGAIQWPLTISERAATGLPHLYVTRPARRAYQTPENEVLVFSLDAIRAAGRKTGWHQSRSREVGLTIRRRVDDSERWLRNRMLSEIERRPIPGSKIARVRSGRSRRRYEAALQVAALYQSLLLRLDRDAIRRMVEQHALVARTDDVLLELLCGFAIEKALGELGWTTSHPGLFSTRKFITAKQDDRVVDVFYQHAPDALNAESIYRHVQEAHTFPGTGRLRPDFALRCSSPQGVRWLLVEVKGVDRPVEDSAREALLDLLGYRRAFNAALNQQGQPYGLGIAWGYGLEPSTSTEITLCTPDTVKTALAMLLETGADHKSPM